MNNANHFRDSIILFLLSNFLVFISAVFLAYGGGAPMPLSLTFTVFGYESLILAIVAFVLAGASLVVAINTVLDVRGKKDV